MATRTLSFNYVLKQNKNDESTAFGKYFAEAYSPNAALSLKGLCHRVAMDQSVFTEEIAAGVIDKLTTDMIELLKSGTSVKWDGLGTFRPTVESMGAATPEAFDVNTMIKGIHVRFIPVNDKGEELTSRKFADLLTFNKYGNKETKKVVLASGKHGYTANIVPTSSIKTKNTLPVLMSVNAAAPAGTLAVGANALTFSGSKERMSYDVYLGDTKIGTGDGVGGQMKITTDALTSGQSGALQIRWDDGKAHNIDFGTFSVA